MNSVTGSGAPIVCSQQNRGVGAGAGLHPKCERLSREHKHEMGRALPASAATTLASTAYTPSPVSRGGSSLVLNRGLHALLHFPFRFSSQRQLCPDQKDRHQRLGSLRVVANRTAPRWVPKLGTVFELVHPRAVYVADKAVRAFDGSFIAMSSEDHNCGVL